MNYSKPPLSFQQQIEAFKQRGLTFEDEHTSRVFLENISYYRLRAYDWQHKKFWN
jgi:abortive infection bacteriophage resistance protein